MYEILNIYRLPNEWEWEWAATGGRRKYPWISRKPKDRLANFANLKGSTTAVDNYPLGSTPEGLMDIAGNIWEWQENWSKYGEKMRALRGGSWCDSEEFLKCTEGMERNPDFNNDNNIGFRVVRIVHY